MDYLLGMLSLVAIFTGSWYLISAWLLWRARPKKR